MKNVFFKTIGAAANQSGAMEAENHVKNGASPKSQMSKLNFLKSLLVILSVSVMLIACGSGGGLSGTWEYKYSENHSITFKFSGKTCTKEFSGIQSVPNTKEQMLDELINKLNKEGIKFTQSRDKIEFVRDGKDAVVTYLFLGTENGQTKVEIREIEKFTYSITDDKIELIDAKGSIDVLSFSRTENTITIDGSRLTKKQ